MRKYGVVFLVVLAVAIGCQSQVQPPTASIQPALDSVAALQTRLNAQIGALQTRANALEARPIVAPFPGDANSFLSGANTWVPAIGYQDTTIVFTGNTWYKAVYMKGITSAWKAWCSPTYATTTPAVDWVVKTTVKTDTVICVRQDPTKSGGTQNLSVDVFALLKR